MDQQNQNLLDLQLDQQSFSYFAESAKWAKFIAIVGFVFCGLMVIVALFAGTIFAAMFASMGNGMGMISGGALTVGYLIFAALWFFPCLYLYRFATQMQQAIQSNEQLKIQQSLRNLKSYFRFVGILFIVILSLYALGILGGLAAGLGRM